jgi:hypothetical protein
METTERLKLTIMDAKERKGEWLKYALTCDASELDTVFGITEALALVEVRAQELFIRQSRPQSET